MARSKSTLSEDQVIALEAHLAGVLTRVVPPIEVVQRLREQIHFPQPKEIVLRLRDWQRMFFVFSGVMSGLLVIITIARALYYFVARKHM